MKKKKKATMSQIRTELEQIGAWLELQKKVKHQGAQVVEQVEKVRSLKDMLKNRKTAL